MPDAAIERSFCTTREAATLLGVSVGTVQLWVENGLLQAWRTAGGHRRVLRDSVDRLLRKQPGPPAAVAPPPEAAQSATRPSVLVVEDDLNLLRLYRRQLSGWPGQPEVIALSNAVAALLRIGRRRPDLLITDLHMPGMDGFAMLHHLRETADLSAMTIVAVTGLGPATVEERGGLPPDVHLLSKPIPFDRLRALWRTVLARAGAVPAPGVPA